MTYRDLTDSDKPLITDATPCRRMGCKTGDVFGYVDDKNIPKDEIKDCQKPTCKDGIQGSEDDDSDEPEDKCKKCNKGVVQNIPRTAKDTNDKTAYEILTTECPDYKNKKQNKIKHVVDGCTRVDDNGAKRGQVHALLDPINRYYQMRFYNGYPAGYLGKGGADQNLNAKNTSTAFGKPQKDFAKSSEALPLPCNIHDVCYQTCGKTKSQCDTEMLGNMRAVCKTAYPAYNRNSPRTLNCPSDFEKSKCQEYIEEAEICYEIAQFMYDELTKNNNSGLWGIPMDIYKSEQVKYCECCGEE